MRKLIFNPAHRSDLGLLRLWAGYGHWQREYTLHALLLGTKFCLEPCNCGVYPRVVQGSAGGDDVTNSSCKVHRASR